MLGVQGAPVGSEVGEGAGASTRVQDDPHQGGLYGVCFSVVVCEFGEAEVLADDGEPVGGRRRV